MPRSHLIQHAAWIRRLTLACGGDVSLAKRHLQWLQEKVFRDNRGDAWTRSTRMTRDEQERLDRFVKERVELNKPLQYILGTQPFCDLEIETQPPVLIPRWETEEWACRLMDRLCDTLPLSNRTPFRILDVCTGTGCIALAMAARLAAHSVDIVAMDISTDAIALAKHNWEVHKKVLQNKVTFLQQDIFDVKDSEVPFDLIVSNPPYVTDLEYATLDADVKDWEDKRALVAADNGTAVHKHVIHLARRIPRTPTLPRLVMEIGGTHQVEGLTSTLRHNGFENVDVWKDLAGKDRAIAAN